MRYDLLYILPALTEDAPTAQTKQKISELLLSNNVTIIREEDQGKRRLAYTVKRIRHGYYMDVVFETDPSVVEKIRASLSLNTDIFVSKFYKRNKQRVSPPRSV